MGNIIGIDKGEKYRQIYARRERVTSSLERTPVGYGQEFIQLKKPERDAYITGYSASGHKILIRRLKKEPSYTERVYVNHNSNHVLFNVLEKVVDTPFGEIIYPKNGGQIEIRVRNGYLGVFSRHKDGQLSYAVSKRLGENASPEQVLGNIENMIVNRAVVLEYNRRKAEVQKGLTTYQNKWENARKRKFNSIFGNLGDIDPEIMKTALRMVEAA